MSILTMSALIFRNRAAFYRETASNTYKAALYPLANVLIEIPWVAVMTLAVRFWSTACAALYTLRASVFVYDIVCVCSSTSTQCISCAYFIIRFNPHAEQFFTFWFFQFLLCMVGTSFGVLLALILPAHQVIMIMFGLSQVNTHLYVLVVPALLR